MNLNILEDKLKKDIKHKIKLIYVIPTFQNLLGTSTTINYRRRFYELALKYQVIIFEDDPYGDLTYFGSEIPKIKSLDKKGLVIYAGFQKY